MKKLICLDIEVYPNYFLLAIKGLDSGKLITFDTQTKLAPQDKRGIHKVLRSYISFGYNSSRYDMPLIQCMLNGDSCKDLYNKSKKLIQDRVPHWRIVEMTEDWDHIDIKEPAPAVMISLKNYGTRLGSKKLWDLPFDPHLPLKDSEIKTLNAYCENDLDTTIDLYHSIKHRIDLRGELSAQYRTDLRSKSDAQIAEAVFVKELRYKGKAPELPKNYRATYKPPSCVYFETDDLNELLTDITAVRFEVGANGSVKMPRELSNRKIVIGDTTYKIGIGGLHSQEKRLVVESNKHFVLRNADVASYYPSMILEFGFYPKQFGRKFLDVYRKIYDTRLAAKKSGDKTVNEGLKIVLNGSFGKLGSKYSKLYSPDLMLQVTLTGQLMLLMLIEQLHKRGFRVVSSNTDGVEYYCERSKLQLAQAIIADWEIDTGMVMEHGEYKGLYAKDVNNYVAVYDGYVKAKGLYTKTSLMKGRSTPIVFEAIREYLLNATPLSQTIMTCKDINEFVSGRTVKGGGEYDGEYLGKVVRWYYSTQSTGYLSYVTNGNKVPKTDGAKPMMDLPDEIPADLNYQWYIDEANSKLEDLGC